MSVDKNRMLYNALTTGSSRVIKGKNKITKNSGKLTPR